MLENRKARRWPWFAALALLAFCVLVGFRTSWLGVSGPTELMSPGTVLTVREDHSGPLAGLVGRSTPDLNPSFRQFCEGIKAKAEGRVSRPAG